MTEITAYAVAAPLWAPDSWGDLPRRGWHTMRLPWRWRVVRVDAVGEEGLAACWTRRRAAALALLLTVETSRTARRVATAAAIRHAEKDQTA